MNTMGTSEIYKIKIFKTGEALIPAPEAYWMSNFNESLKISFHAILAYNDKTNFLINTGLPEDLVERNEQMRKFYGKKAEFKKEKNIDLLLSDYGFKSEDIHNVSFTPMQDYTTGQLDIFKNARLFINRKGWIQDIIAPEIPKHSSRNLFIPDKIMKFILFTSWENVNLFDSDDITELIPGIHSLWTGCHHRSSTAFIVNTEKGNMIFTDSAFKKRNIEEDLPIGIAENIFECHSAYSKLKGYGTILPLYDPEIDDLIL